MIGLSASKPATATPAKQAPAAEAGHAVLSFIPAGTPRSVAEYLVAAIAGAVLLFAFFLLAEIAGVLFRSDIIAIVFLPVICIMPVISGAISTLLLEKLRSKPLTFQRGAMVGAASGLAGASVSALMLFVLDMFAKIHPFGSLATGLVLLVVLIPIAIVDGLLGALGGALVVKFVKDI